MNENLQARFMASMNSSTELPKLLPPLLLNESVQSETRDSSFFMRPV